jgi:hypothetical protein
MKTQANKQLKYGAKCSVVKGTHAGKSGTVKDINTSKTGAITITVLQPNGERFKTLAKNVEIFGSQSKHRTTEGKKIMGKSILAYNASQTKEVKKICVTLMAEINRALPKAESKIWHGNPVWFLDGNPVVGYSKRKHFVALLFWSGQTFGEEDLLPEGSFKAAEARFTNVDQIHKTNLRRWLKKSKQIQWDYKNIVKRKGKLVRLA